MKCGILSASKVLKTCWSLGSPSPSSCCDTRLALLPGPSSVHLLFCGHIEASCLLVWLLLRQCLLLVYFKIPDAMDLPNIASGVSPNSVSLCWS